MSPQTLISRWGSVCINTVTAVISYFSFLTFYWALGKQRVKLFSKTRLSLYQYFILWVRFTLFYLDRFLLQHTLLPLLIYQFWQSSYQRRPSRWKGTSMFNLKLFLPLTNTLYIVKVLKTQKCYNSYHNGSFKHRTSGFIHPIQLLIYSSAKNFIVNYNCHLKSVMPIRTILG